MIQFVCSSDTIDGRYCYTPGVVRQNAYARAYVYDPANNFWSPRISVSSGM
jgi:hypothetical protein